MRPCIRAPHQAPPDRVDGPMRSDAIVHHCALIQEYESTKYGVLWYKNTDMVGIRRKFGKKEQCFSFGGKKAGLTEEKGRAFGDDALRKLDGGMTEAQVKEWADRAVQP